MDTMDTKTPPMDTKTPPSKDTVLWVSYTTQYFNAILKCQLCNKIVNLLHVRVHIWNWITFFVLHIFTRIRKQIAKHYLEKEGCAVRQVWFYASYRMHAFCKANEVFTLCKPSTR